MCIRDRYNTPHIHCRCRNEDNQLTSIGRIYRIYYNHLKAGKEPIEALKEMNIFRMCCRSRFLSIPLEHMIDRSKERYFNHEKNNIVKFDTRELEPLVEPPNFPLLPS